LTWKSGRPIGVGLIRPQDDHFQVEKRFQRVDALCAPAASAASGGVQLGIRIPAELSFRSKGYPVPKLIEVDSANGTVLLQVPAGSAEISAVSRTRDVIEKVASSLGEVLGIVGGVAQGFSDAIKTAPVESAELEFGLQFTAAGRLYVVDLGTQGAFKVTLKVAPGITNGPCTATEPTAGTA
jgi:hypothetical protein